MYNGIGLLTARGSGTSGHVQTNKFNLRGRPPPRQDFNEDREMPVNKQPNTAILEHNKKREIELKVAQMVAELEDAGCVRALMHASAPRPSQGASVQRTTTC